MEGANASAPERRFWLAGLVLGLLPTLSGILFRTYSYHVTPGWYEQLRQIDALFVAFEFCVIFLARKHGMDYARLAAGLARPDRIAAGVFLATFWISSVFFSQFPPVSSLRIVIWLTHFAFAFAVFHLSRTMTRQAVEDFAKGCFLGLCTYVPILAVHFALAPDPASLPGKTVIWSSAVPGYLSVRLFGFTTAALALLAIGVLWTRSRFALADWWLHGGLLLSLTLTFWSGTRGGIYAVMLAACALPVVARTRPRAFWIAVTGIAGLTALWLSQLIYQPDVTFGSVRLEAGQDGFTSGRYEIWLRSIEWIAQRPLFGWGESAISWLLENNPGHQQPHNALLQILLSWGAIASAAAVYLGFRVLQVIVTEARTSPDLLAPLTVLIGLLVMSSVDGIFYNPRTTMLVIVAGAGALAMALRNRARMDGTRSRARDAERPAPGPGEAAF